MQKKFSFSAQKETKTGKTDKKNTQKTDFEPLQTINEPILALLLAIFVSSILQRLNDLVIKNKKL